jgi:hypothetical protein
MLVSSSFAILISAAAAIASTHQARSHHPTKRADNSTFTVGKRGDQYVNKKFSWYPTDTGTYVHFAFSFFLFPLLNSLLLVMPAPVKITKTAISCVSSAFWALIPSLPLTLTLRSTLRWLPP